MQSHCQCSIVACLACAMVICACAQQRDPQDWRERLLEIPEASDLVATRVSSAKSMLFPWADRDTVVWSQFGEKTWQILVRRGSDSQVVYEIDDALHPWSISPTYLDGTTLVWAEYYQKGEAGPIIWHLYWMDIDKRERQEIADNEDNERVQQVNFGIQGGLIVYDFLYRDSVRHPTSEVTIYDTRTSKIRKTLKDENAAFFGPTISEGRVVFCKFSIRADGRNDSRLMIYRIIEDRLESLDAGESCFQPFLFGNTLVFNDAEDPMSLGTIVHYDLVGKKKSVLWPDKRYLPPDIYSDLAKSGGNSPTVNTRYIAWDYNLGPPVLYDLKTRRLVRLNSDSSERVLRIRATPRHIVWFGYNRSDRSNFVSWSRLD